MSEYNPTYEGKTDKHRVYWKCNNCAVSFLTWDIPAGDHAKCMELGVKWIDECSNCGVEITKENEGTVWIQYYKFKPRSIKYIKPSLDNKDMRDLFPEIGKSQ